jgi:hypothetical protein
MAGNVQADASGNILVEFDYDSIIVVDPNKTIDDFGNIKERLVDHENLVMYANLEADVLPRTKLAVGISPQNSGFETISVAKINFLKPTKNSYLGTGYYDQLTGENTTQFKGQNQMLEKGVDANGENPYVVNTVANQKDIIDTGLLGITSINIKTNSSFVPTVEILLEDVQGKGLFELGDNSPYSAFFNLPYPQFYLTLKGYYGQAVRYQLNLKNFHASFNGFTGNYVVRLNFVGYKFNILNEISMGHLVAAPHMYSQRFDISQTVTGPQQPNKAAESQANTQAERGANNLGSNQEVVTQIVAEKGYQKIVEVYSEYKAKGLIEPNFPELTLVQLMTKLDNFENNIMSSFDKVDVASLTNVRNYKGVLVQYFSNIRGGNTSWFSTYLDPKPFVLKSGQKLYVFKKLSREEKNRAIEEVLKKQIIEFNGALAENATLGVRGLTPIPNPIKYDMLVAKPPGINDIDWRETTRIQTGIINPTLQDETRVKSSVSSVFIPTEIELSSNPFGATVGAVSSILNSTVNLVPQEWFVFEGEDRFDKQITLLETQANKKLSDFESEITALLLRKIEDTATGIGFKPTVRNMIAVIMASAEGFIRLMDEVHTKAWEVKYDPIRSRAILENPSSAQSSETVDFVSRDKSNLMNENQMDSEAINSQIPVYPWPQFFVETNENGEPKFQLKYIADPTVVDLTQGYLFDKWPEVEFVEEYMKGLTQKFQNPNAPPPLDNERDTNIININAIEYPSVGLAYSNKEEIKFFYEIWERQFITSHYSGLIRANLNQVDELIKLNIETEVNNIKNKLGISSPYLSLKLKNFNLNSTNYPDFLRSISNSGTGRAYQDYIRDFFVTPYLKVITENSYEILSTLDLGKVPQASTKSEALRSLIVSDSNTPLIVDTLPYTNPNWCLNNLNQGNTAVSNQVYNTNKSLTIFEPRKIIANFTDVYNYTTNRPVTNFSYLVNQNPYTKVETSGIGTFGPVGVGFLYTFRSPKDFVATEGYVDGNTPTGVVGSRTTTSMLNTPYFINAIQNGVYNSRFSGNTYPYVQAAYLFLNSLPLATLREKYKSYENNVTSDLDYISSALKKFGAIHKLPYAWILKYGSIWHRYKKYKESNVDILETAWKNFNYQENFYPPTSSTTKVYFFQYKGSTRDIQLQSEGVADISMQVGFYPKLINDFNVFYNGYDLYLNYTDKEIQQSVNAGMKLYNFSDSNIVNAKQGDKSLRLITWSVVLPNTTPEAPIDCNPNDNTKGSDYFVVPSFGSPLNQSVAACIENVSTIPTTKVNFTDNTSVFNGSVRCLWSTPNYGYFDSNQLAFPQPDSYLNFITTGSTVQTPLHFLTQDNYTKIEEVFSVFEKKILDSFELEFLNFCKSINNVTSGIQRVTFGQSPVDMNANFRNFQSLFRSLMTVPVQAKGETDEQYFTNTINNQYSLFQNGIKSFMEYDVVFKYGNPSNYQRRIFDSYLSHNNTDVVVDPIIFNPYVPNSLPQIGGNLTLSQSQANNPQAWLALETEVGFSTIPNVRYSSFGSYITDFFIDNNIEFTSQNVTLLAPIIKMFATQKLNNPNISASQFQTQLSQYLRRESSLQDNFLNGVLSRLRQPPPIGLPNQQQLPERVVNSVITGDQSKVENYEVFKALNDKWIAGGDYTTKTLFEDFLFLDRASRNIGDKILIDIFALKKVFNTESLNQEMSVFTFVSGILIRNNFTVMPLPSYVNFYNVQDIDGTDIIKPEGSLEFANNLWGTFLDVDYRNSSSKFLCFFVGKPSQYPNLPKQTSKYRNDAFEMRRASGNPLLSQLPFSRRERALSNRCVGFNVDVGTRNQNIFYSLTVSQDNGNATSESINIQLDMSNQATGRAVATQNTGLYNYYKNRSYKATVTCLGNALLQPTMYFNLRHVPMFEGSYMITDVSHSIQAGSFQTTFDGVRQGFFDLPTIDSLLQSINQNLVTKLEEILKINKDQVKVSATTNNIKSSEIVQSADNTLDTTNSCSSKITAGTYTNAIPGYVAVNGTLTEVTPTDFATALNRLLPNEPDLRTFIYCISYIRTFQETSNTKEGTFNGWNNNLGTLSLSVDWKGQVQLFPRVYSCVNIRTNPSTSSSQPIIHFESLDNYITFMAGRLRANVDRVIRLGLAKYYVCHWPTDNISEQYFDDNINEFNQTIETFTNALSSAGSVGLSSVDKFLEYKQTMDEGKNNSNTPEVTPTPVPPNEGQTCPPPVVSTFSPSAGYTGTIVQVNGRNFESVKSITVAGQNVDINNITVFNTETLRFILPAITIPAGQDVATGRIIVTTEFGTFESLVNFTFNPTLENVITSSPGGNADTTTQQEISVSQQEEAGATANIQNTMLNEPIFVTKKTNELGTEEVTAKIGQSDFEDGGWTINPVALYSFRINVIEVGPNNTVTSSKVTSGNFLDLAGFVSQDGQTFSITRDQFIQAKFIEDIEFEKGKRLEIQTEIKLTARPADREKYPNDSTKEINFRIIVPSSELRVQPEGSLSFIERSTDVALPRFQGPLYYNIVRPDGGYITYRFNCPRCVISKVQVARSSNQTVPLVVTTTNDSNTRYTNVINVNALGSFVLSIIYQNADNPGTFTATSNVFTL